MTILIVVNKSITHEYNVFVKLKVNDEESIVEQLTEMYVI